MNILSEDKSKPCIETLYQQLTCLSLPTKREEFALNTGLLDGNANRRISVARVQGILFCIHFGNGCAIWGVLITNEAPGFEISLHRDDDALRENETRKGEKKTK